MRFTTATRLVLEVVMAAPVDDPAWGYRIIEESGLGSGTVYPILERLEEEGFVRAEWEPSTSDGGPRRRFYKVTGEGQAWYAEHARGRLWAVPAPNGATP